MKLKTYTIFWLTGEKETFKGKSISDAMIRAGYNDEVIRNVAFYDKGDSKKNYHWNKEINIWEKN